MTSVLVVDDVALFRRGLASALTAEGFEVVGQASDAEAAVTESEAFQPEVIVLDILMPGLSGLEVVEKIHAVAPESHIVLLSSSESEEDLLQGIKSGVRGYLNKDASFEVLAGAITDVVAGGAVVSPLMAGKLFDATRQLLRHHELIGTRKPVLTGREIEVLELVAKGHTSREIGQDLYISENTVKNHVRNILDKLGLHSRSEAVLYAIREDLISL
ncbi:MAG: response regulator transcription factor, partial [Acidimicrobiia bacterium]|nr:response regulator transcription factor [Acidimicrobiia bacterium]MDH3471678.1 response regulator transcription factor [Acidimicrobiia bacterium]